MKGLILKTISLVVAAAIAATVPAAGVYAKAGDSGYEGGISSGENGDDTVYEYQEVLFLTGEPIVLKGTVEVSSKEKSGKVTTTYKYSLANLDRDAALTRQLSFTTVLSKEANGQTTEKTSFSKKPAETVTVGETTYTLIDYDFTKSRLVDPKPAVIYFAGNLHGKKVYQAGAAADGTTVTIESTGDIYGYESSRGSSEMQLINYTIRSERKLSGGGSDKWGGTATVALAASTVRQLKYVRNLPEEISFKGGSLVQFNFTDTQTLLDAQKNPDKYRDLLVRVATFTSFFVELSPPLQNDIINRLEITAF
jgi:N-acetylmuramoyl-L-alanine amidase